MFFLDAHVHIYPEYRLDALFDVFAARAEKLAPGCGGMAMAVMLREFQPTLESLLDASRMGSWRIADRAAGGPLVVEDGTRRISLFPARQVAARERIELLGFFGEEPVPDGLPLAETADRLRAAGYVPVVAWGKGKWLFRRAATVRATILREALHRPPPFIGDSALRPFFWREPLFALARRLSLRFTYGSDPLPGAGNERKAGRYATLVDAPPPQTAADLLRALQTAPLRPCGRRAAY